MKTIQTYEEFKKDWEATHSISPAPSEKSWKSMINRAEVFPVMPGKIDEFENLQISVFHSKAGMSYMSGNRYPAGHYITFQPCSVQETSMGEALLSCILMGDQRQSGYKHLLDTSARKNPHYIKKVMLALAVTKDAIAKAYYEGNYAKCNEFAGYANKVAKGEEI